MNKEPLFLYIFRFVLGLGLFAFMMMLYWSSALLEQDLKSLQKDIFQIKNDLSHIRSTLDKLKTTHSQLILNQASNTDSTSTEIAHSQNNLLKPDPFYLTVLPELLGPHFTPQGIRKEASIGVPPHLHPFSNWVEGATWNAMCTVAMASQELGKYETLTPDMAHTMELRYTPEGYPEYWLFLRKDVFWQPLDPHHFSDQVELAPFFLHKHQVTAHDFKFYFDAFMNPHVEEEQAVVLRTYLGDIEEIRVIDDFTLVVRWKTQKIQQEDGNVNYQMKYTSKSLTGSLRPLPRFVYQYFSDGTKIVADDEDPNTYRTNAIWAQNFSHHWAKNIIVSCGPWLFDGLTEREIRFRRNPDYYEPLAVLVEGLEIKFRSSFDAIWEDFKSGQLDAVTLPPHQLNELERFLMSSPYQKQAQQGLGIKQLNYVGRSYTYVGWNEARPLFNSSKVRQALTLAIDRERIIRQNLNGMGIQTTGTFFPYSPSYDHRLKPYPFDPDQARQLLLEEGWYDHNGDGILDKWVDGQWIPFRFTLTYFVKNSTTKAISEYIATALKEIGIDCKLNGVDLADLSNVFENKDFDAVILAWSLGTPPENPRQLWYSTGAKEKGSSNTIGFANAEVDKIIDLLDYEYDPQKRIELYHRFDALLYEEAPYTFLYTPKINFVYRDYLQNVFIPAERQDLFPEANVGEPQSSLFWIRKKSP